MRYTFYKFVLLLVPQILWCQTSSQQFTGFMKGNGDNKAIEMKFSFLNDSINGIYWYDDIGIDLAVHGSIRNNQLYLEEHNSAGKVTGFFNGTCFNNSDSISGIWTRKKDNAHFTFNIKKTEWLNYKLIKKNVSWYRNKKVDLDERAIYSEWLEMSENGETEVQNIFNSLPNNSAVEQPDKTTSLGKGFYGIEIDGMLTYFTQHREVNLQLKTNEFISFGDYRSSFWGGTTDNNMGYYLFDLHSASVVHLNNILRKDTSSFPILRNLLKTAMKKNGTWNRFQEDMGNLEDFIADGKTPFEEQFYIKEDGIYFFFCRLPFSNIFSIDDVKISFTQLMPILDRESCIYKWLQKQTR